MFDSVYEDEDGMQVSLSCVTTKSRLVFKERATGDAAVFFIRPAVTSASVKRYDNGYQMCFPDPFQGTACASQKKVYM